MKIISLFSPEQFYVTIFANPMLNAKKRYPIIRKIKICVKNCFLFSYDDGSNAIPTTIIDDAVYVIPPFGVIIEF